MLEHYYLVKAMGLPNAIFGSEDIGNLKAYCQKLIEAGFNRLQVDEVTHKPYEWRD